MNSLFVISRSNEMADWEVKGKTFIVTGGASGMGAMYLETFIKKGAKSVAILDIAVEQGQALAAKYEKTHPGQVTFIKCDMSKEEDIEKAFQEVVNKFQQIDVIINNAGIMVDAPAVWRTAASVNFEGVVSLTLKGINHMDKSEGGAGGAIVNIASIAALTRVPFIPIYCGAKSAVMHFSRSITYGPFYKNSGVRILCMCFGPTDTPLMQNLGKRAYSPKYGEALLASIPDEGVNNQKVESAISGVERMLENGACGSVWLTINDKPAKDITELVDQAYAPLENELK